MKTHVFFRNLLLCLIIIYFAQGSLYSSGSLISQGVLFLILTISISYLLKTLLMKSPKPQIYWLFLVFLIVNTLSFLMTGGYLDSVAFSMMKVIALGSLTFYPFFYFSRIAILDIKILQGFAILFLIVSILSFYHNQTIYIDRFDRTENEVVNNVAYNFVLLIPFLISLINGKKIMMVIISAVIIFFIITGAKRGAILTGGVGFVFVIYAFLKVQKSRFKILNYLALLLILVIGFYYASDLIVNNDFLQRRIELTEEGNSSGRNIIYSMIYFGWLNSDSFFHLLFGYGFAGSTVLANGSMAHNDWLELLSNFGLIGVCFYIYLFSHLFNFFLNVKWSTEKRIFMLCVVSLWIFRTLFSMGYNTETFILTTIPLAYCFGSTNYDLKHNLAI